MAYDTSSGGRFCSVRPWFWPVVVAFLFLFAAPRSASPFVGAVLRSESPEPEESPSRAGFAVRCGKRWSTLRLWTCLGAPGAELELQIRDRARASGGYEIRSTHEYLRTTGRSTRAHRSSWSVAMPEEPGIYPLTVGRSGTNDTVRVQVIVWRPRAQMEGDRLNGYRIGSYPSGRPGMRPIYRPPPGFVEVTSANRSKRLSPHFRLEQFLCKQESGYPKYLVLRPALLLRLELILEALRERGFDLSTLHVMSGYRTPFYNEAIGNVRFSRHVWGGAADIFVDGDEDEYMDDLDGDGRIDEGDAEWLRRLIPEVGPTPADERFQGGLSAYGSTSAHGPFVHVDVRGYRARW